LAPRRSAFRRLLPARFAPVKSRFFKSAPERSAPERSARSPPGCPLWNFSCASRMSFSFLPLCRMVSAFLGSLYRRTTVRVVLSSICNCYDFLCYSTGKRVMIKSNAMSRQ
jgi:hypothetical protein